VGADSPNTARLAVPRHDVRGFELLNLFRLDGRRRDQRVEAPRECLTRQQAPRLVKMVADIVNIGALTGPTVAMAEALVARTGRSADVLGRLIVR
jgi:hypothetical protein